MRDIDLLIVGPAGHDTGGVARYIDEHRRILPSGIGTRTYDVATPRGTGSTRFLRAVLGALWDMLRFPFRRRPDVVHVHTSHYLSFYLSAFYVLFASVAWRRPVVVHVHGSSFDEFVRTDLAPVAWLQSIVLGAADRVVVLSPYWRDVLSRRVPERKLVVLPNAVDPDEYDPRYDVDPPHVAFVSNHIRRKGIEELTDAVDALLSEGLDFRTTIAGKGPLSDHARDLDERWESVEYVGYVSEAEKRAILNRASIYALPTHAEGLPIALLEGMAGGNALVSTRVGSIPDVVDASNGELIDPGDADALRAALRRLVADPERVARMARTNRELIETTYSWERTAERLVTLYGNLCAPARDRPGRERAGNEGSSAERPGAERSAGTIGDRAFDD